MEEEVSMKWAAKTYEYFRGKSQGTPLNPLQPLQMELGRGERVLMRNSSAVRLHDAFPLARSP